MNEIISNYGPYLTVRNTSVTDSFRPSATGMDLPSVTARYKSEYCEITAIPTHEQYIGCAVSTDKDKAITGAYCEALERISVACWWAFDSSFKSRSTDYETFSSLDEHGFTYVTGQIPTYKNLGICAVTLLAAKKAPFAVLGVGFAEQTTDALEKSQFEAVHSWVGSEWYAQRGISIGWDFAEIEKRLVAGSELDQECDSRMSAPLDTATVMHAYHEKAPNAELKVRECDLGYVAWLGYDHGDRLASFQLAKIFMPDGRIKVFTEPNQ